MRQKVAPEFWENFYDHEDDGFERFKNAVQQLNKNYLGFLPVIQKLEEMRNLLDTKRVVYGETNLLIVLKSIIRSTLHSQLPTPKHQKIIEEFYKLSFNVFYYSDKEHQGK